MRILFDTQRQFKEGQPTPKLFHRQMEVLSKFANGKSSKEWPSCLTRETVSPYLNRFGERKPVFVGQLFGSGS